MTDATGIPETQFERLRRLCKNLGLTVDEALAEKADELAIRSFLKCIPDEGIKRARVPEFVAEVLGEAPDDDLLKRLDAQSRGPRIEHDEYLELETAQHGRCALCGAILMHSVRPQVDHILPIALGGKSESANYQLLCQQCNLGKSKLVGWVMGAPFLDEGIGCKVRYCVLTRWQRKCTAPECNESSRTAVLEVVPIVPVQRGGRMIFDNLRVLCADHAATERRKWKEDAIRRLRYANWRVAWK